MRPSFKLHRRTSTRVGTAGRLAPYTPPLTLRATMPGAIAAAPTMRSMSSDEIDAFVSTQGFGVLSLAHGNRAYGAPLFYGAREGAIYFQTREGAKSRYLYATTEACLTVSSTRAMGEWASVQLIGRLERVDGFASTSPAASAIMGIPPPLAWGDDDERADEARAAGVTTFRLIPIRRAGRHSQPAKLDGVERHDGY